MQIEQTLDSLRATGNLRAIPTEAPGGVTDLSSNDYLGLGADRRLREEFFGLYDPADLAMTSSASRLLVGSQQAYASLERILAASYGHGRVALMFNSGYHANTGLVSALADKSTLIVADKLIHASVIDGIRLSGAPFERFRHNDYGHLQRILEGKARDYASVLIIAESIYSMDGDRADLPRLAALKKLHPGAMLYVDEAHAVGVLGPGGLGESARTGTLGDVDILVGTLGKALASMGAYAIVSPVVREFLVNKARSLIFSTALPPVQALWSEFVWRKAIAADDRRRALETLAQKLAAIIPGGEPSHIRPLITGSAAKALEMSARLLDGGYKVLPIRTPTVPPGTERLRFSLSADINPDALDKLSTLL